MAFWNKFPYSNFHEINLDWIIREMKKISGSVSDFARHWEKALQTETGERQEADRQLQENINAEQDRAEAAEEALDQKIMEESVNAISEADVLIVGGTSLAVYPAAGLLRYFQGEALIVLNRSATPVDGNADLLIEEPIGQVMARIKVR